MNARSYEYCVDCYENDGIAEAYALESAVYLMFGIFDYESFDEEDKFFPCKDCGVKLLRHPMYLEAFSKRNAEFAHKTVCDLPDISDSAKISLYVLLKNFSVPSFAISIDRTDKAIDVLKELSLEGYVEYYVHESSENITVILNAYKLGLFTNEAVLSKMKAQQKMFNDPYWLKNSENYKTRKHSQLRKERVEALPNEFTDEERDELLEDFDNKCAFTGKEDVKLHIDHVIPVSAGKGGTIVGNMLPIWSRINTSKGDKNVFEWYNNNADRFYVNPELFNAAMTYIADKNGMSLDEYKEYVYRCFEAE